MALPEQVCEKCLCYSLHDQPGWFRCPGCGFMWKGIKSMISLQELLGDTKYEDLSQELKDNAEELLKRVNLFRAKYGIPMYVNSGYRNPEHNASIGGAKNSSHCMCQAIDFKDNDGKLFEYIKANPNILEECDLYVEDPRWTASWIHLQSRKIASGNRVFLPYSDGRPATAPEREIKL